MTRRAALIAVVAFVLPGIAQAQPLRLPSSAVPAPRLASTPVDSHEVASSIGTGAAVTGALVEGIGLGASVNTKMLKASRELADGAGLVTPYVATGVDYAGAIKTSKSVTGGAKVLGNVVAGVELAADVTSAGISCSNGEVGTCVLDTLDVGADLAAYGGPMVKAGSLAYTGGKLTGKAITAGYEYVAGQSLGADWYDWVFHEGETPKILNEATTPAAFAAARAKRQEAFSRSQGILQSKQAYEDARQASLAAERQAAAQQAAVRASDNAQSMAFVNGLVAVAQQAQQASQSASGGAQGSRELAGSGSGTRSSSGPTCADSPDPRACQR